MISVYLRSLGCSKNQVDSELMCGVLKKDSFRIVDDPALAEVIVVNTCGFIEAAKEESIENILALAEYKTSGRCRLLLAVGCMAEKYAAEMAEAMPEIDALMGVGQYQNIAALIKEQLCLPYSQSQPVADNVYMERDRAALGASAYIKIAEGCDNNCSFCLIPQLRGPYKSRPMEDILEEAQALAQQGVKELILLAQNTTYYGIDIYGEARLSTLLEKLAALPFAMIRILYAYPEGIDAALIQVMSSHGNICHYLDMPIQHGVDHILADMNRPDTAASILQTIDDLRRAMPDISLRTTVMVGFPGESEADFQQLLTFMDKASFDWVGAFPYYQEDDTPAAALPQQLDKDTKQERLDVLLEYTAQISAKRRQQYIGRLLPVLVTESAEDLYGSGWLAARSQYQAPDVDGLIYFSSNNAAIGDIVNVRITDSDIYDLKGEQE